MDNEDICRVFSGDSDMARYLRALDWSKTVLPPPAQWPQSLRTIVRVMLNSGHAMYVFWGDQHACLYNDAYARLIGPDRHPSSIGQPGRTVWREIWPIIGPQIEQVMAGGGPTWHENALVPITRGDRIEEVFWTYSYSPIDEDAAENGIGGVLVVCSDTTRTVQAERDARLSGKRFASLFDQSPIFMTLLQGPDHVFEYCNPAYMQLIGYRQVVGLPVAEGLPEAAAQGFVELLDAVYKSGEPYRALGTEIDIQRTLGVAPETRKLDFVYQPVTDDVGEVTGIFVVGSDVTERYTAEAALRHSEEQLRLAIEAAEVGLWDVDPVNGTLFWPPRVKAMFGISPSVPVSMEDFYAGLHPDDFAHTADAFASAIDPERRETYDVEYRTIGKEDGVVRWVAAKGKGVFDETGRPLRAVGTAIDITERKKAERRRDALIELSDRIRDAESADDLAYCAAVVIGETLEVSRAGFGIVDEQARALHVLRDWVAPGAQSLTGNISLGGYPDFVSDLKFGRSIAIADVFLDDRSMPAAPRWARASARSLVNVPVIERGELVAILFVNHAEVRAWSEDEIEFIEEVAARTRTATERLRSDAALKALNQDLERRVAEELAEKSLLAEIVESTDVLVQVIDTDFNWLAVNAASADAFERLFKVRPEVGGNMLNALQSAPPVRADAKVVWGRAFAGEAFSEVVTFDDPAGGSRHFEMKFNPLRNGEGHIIGGYQFVYDVTDRLREQERLAEAEAHLRQSQKMEAVGQLTGGIAHDFNNMLAVVMGSLELLNRRITDDARANHYISQSIDAAKRAATLTQRLLAFSRQQPLQPEAFSPNRLVAGMSELLAHALGGNVRLETVLGAGLWTVEADPNQLENVIVNLAVNARDAMPEGGKVTIETLNCHLDERYVQAEMGVPAGQYVLIAVTDTGTGMPPEVMTKAFDPFFTTKEVGKGTGLGLSQVYGFVKQSGGHIKIYSEIGQGTTIKIYLPRHGAEVASLREDEPSLPALPGKEKEVVLVVDDEAVVRQFTVDAVSELGYRVLEAGSAAEALKLLDAHPEVSLLFTDIVMPDVNGRKLADQALAQRPDLKVLYTTGYTRNAVVHNGVLDAGVHLIGKPFTLDELAAKLWAVLDES